GERKSCFDGASFMNLSLAPHSDGLRRVIKEGGGNGKESLHHHPIFPYHNYEEEIGTKLRIDLRKGSICTAATHTSRLSSADNEPRLKAINFTKTT
ncbi:hypothetical protein KIN20_030971, partial [Parelaphostrongylus tenuis]